VNGKAELTLEQLREWRKSLKQHHMCQRIVLGGHTHCDCGAEAVRAEILAAITEAQRPDKLHGWTPGRDVNPVPSRKVLLLHASGTVTVQDSAEYVSLSCTHHRTLELPEGEPCRE